MEYHIPVLYQEVIDNLITDKDGVYVDCTLGGGGHSQGILENLGESGRLIAIDQDNEAIAFASKRLEGFKNKLSIFKNNFENIEMVAYLGGVEKVDGILMDIGVSSKQLDDPERGFSYRYNAELDMRMDKSNDQTAKKIINEYPEEELARIIYQYGEDRNSRRIARAIVEKRKDKTIETTDELVGIIASVMKSKTNKHPAKQTFQALRIEVNRELEVLKTAIDKSVDLLKPGGRIAIITFHSIEDRIVKEKFKELSKGCICPPDFPKCVCGKTPKLKIITKKPIIASKDELTDNRRSHSAKLRIAERV